MCFMNTTMKSESFLSANYRRNQCHTFDENQWIKWRKELTNVLSELPNHLRRSTLNIFNLFLRAVGYGNEMVVQCGKIAEHWGSEMVVLGVNIALIVVVVAVWCSYWLGEENELWRIDATIPTIQFVFCLIRCYPKEMIFVSLFVCNISCKKSCNQNGKPN